MVSLVRTKITWINLLFQGKEGHIVHEDNPSRAFAGQTQDNVGVQLGTVLEY